MRRKEAKIVILSLGVIETPIAIKASEAHTERMEMIKQVTSLKRNAQTENIVAVIEFLVSDAVLFITNTLFLLMPA